MNLTNSDEIDKVIYDEDSDDSEEDYSSEEDVQEDDAQEDDAQSDAQEDDTQSELLSTEPLKKKRGRKCKPKDENQPIEKVQKKRGRKPKQKDPDETEKIPKKRGRKPKEKVYSVKELPKTFFEENKNEALILHLPIKESDKIEDVPVPDINNIIEYSIFDENMNNYNINNSDLLPTQQNFLEDSFKENNNNLHFENEKYEVNIKKEEPEDDVKSNRIFKKNLKNIMYEFINANNDKTWPESTNTYCWWCCHPFEGVPCALPEYYKKDKFYVNGCFCSFNCTASYNFSKNDDDIWERYSLLNLMYKKLYNNKYTKISLAPPREVLKIFGGYMSIEEFRENSLKNEKTFILIKPPLISIISKIEENISSSKSVKNNFPLINENILNKTQNNLKLKRNKPVTNPNSTLQSFMDLKII
jgi:hypothetical protein